MISLILTIMVITLTTVGALASLALLVVPVVARVFNVGVKIRLKWITILTDLSVRWLGLGKIRDMTVMIDSTGVSEKTRKEVIKHMGGTGQYGFMDSTKNIPGLLTSLGDISE